MATVNRFDYVKYDEWSTAMQAKFKEQFQVLEAIAEKHLINGRAKSLLLTSLEEAYMWCGKAIRDQQPTNVIQEDRNNG